MREIYYGPGGMPQNSNVLGDDFLKNLARKLRAQSLREADGDPGATPVETSPADAVDAASASVDKQIFKILNAALKESVTSKSEGLNFRDMTRRLLEADDDEEDVGGLLGGDGGGEDDTSADTTPQAPAKKSLDEIDLGSYAEAVVRLIDNFESLIETRDTIVKMAEVQLKKNYDPSVLQAFTDLLEEEYDVSVGGSSWDKETEYQPPPAAGAGPTGA